MEEWKKDRYQIEQIYSKEPPKSEEQTGIWYYIVNDKKEKEKCLLSQIKGREHINECLPQLFELDKKGVQNEFVECFSENSELFVVFIHYEMQNLRQYLSKTILDTNERLFLLCQILKKMMLYQDLPEILQSAMWDIDFIRIEQEEIKFDFKVDLERIPQKKIKLFEFLFLPEERKTNGIRLLIEQIQKGVNTSTKELLAEVEQLLNRELDRKEKKKEKIRIKKEQFIWYGKILILLFIMIGSLFIIRQILFDIKPEKLDNPDREDISVIGTITIDQTE